MMAKNSPQKNKDMLAILRGDTIENAVAGRTDENGNEIPEGMPRWRWRMGQRRKGE